MELLLWMLMAVFTGVVATNLNRNAIAWVVATIFFGPIPLVILFFLPKLKGGHYQ